MGTDEGKTVQEKYDEYMNKAPTALTLKDDDAFKTCQTNYEKNYTDKTEWDKNDVKKTALKKKCFAYEDEVCVFTNEKTTKFIAEGKFKGDEKQYCTDIQKSAVLACKAALIGNKDCKADCDKLSTASSASSLTTTVLLALSAFAFVSM